jgi:hypothetical protein
MMRLCLCKLADLPRELQRPRKIVDLKDAPQTFDSIDLDDLPVRDLARELGDLSNRYGRRVLAARDARHSRQRLHLRVPPLLVIGGFL